MPPSNERENRPPGGAVWHLWRNKLTYAGGFVALVAALLVLGFLFFDLLTPGPNPYVGLFTFLVLPGILVVGLGVAAVGLLLAWLRVRHRVGAGDRTRLLPPIDLSLQTHRRTLKWLGIGLLVLLPFTGVMSYEGYNYTESNRFCGLVCHGVMQPEYVAHLHSPHARVECAECHIGSGASWYVKSKLSGVRQVVAVALDTYPRPLPPAITELRPAAETCEQCHWPERFLGDQLVVRSHFEADEASTPAPLKILVKTGGADPTTGPVSGIHWHMALGNSVEYVAEDRALQRIPWARITDHATGKSVVYRSDGVKGDEPPAGIRRTVDCMDCHNRATHVFRSPQVAANDALEVDASLRELPFAKREMVAALVAPYASREAGEAGVANALRSYYAKEHPDLAKTHAEQIDALIQAAQKAYRRAFFPEMKTDWRAYVSNLGHKDSPGCFRCHDGRHVDAKGRAIRRDCSTCHEFLVPTDPKKPDSPVQIGEFEHPIALEGAHAEMRCDRCHTGGVAPSRECAGCHTEVAAFLAGTTPALASFGISADGMSPGVGCTDCHDLTKPTDAKTLEAACNDCHDDTLPYPDVVARWQKEVAGLMKKAEAHGGSEADPALAALRAAGPLHNMNATRKVLRALAARED